MEKDQHWPEISDERLKAAVQEYLQQHPNRAGNKHYWLFEQSRFYDMWDDWWRQKIDPRKMNDVQHYTENGRFWVLRIRHLIAIYLSAVVLSGIVYVAMGIYI